MQVRNYLMVLTFLLLFLIALTCSSASNTSDYADIVLLNGSVYTVDKGTDWSSHPEEAIAWKGERIVSINTSEGMTPFIGPETDVIDLSGKMVLPGFVDTHIHLGAAAMLMAGVNLTGCRSVLEVQNILKDYAVKNPDMEVIRGFGWNYFMFEGSGPDKEMIDEIITDKPVILTSFDGHATWVNSKALEIAGIDDQTPDPAGGKIEHRSDGNPSGVLREMAASDLVSNKVPSLTSDQIQEKLEELLPRIAKSGIISADDAAVSPEMIEAYARLEDEDGLPVRVFGEIVALPEISEEIMKVTEDINKTESEVLKDQTGTGFLTDLPVSSLSEKEDCIPVESIDEYLDQEGLFRIQTGKLFLDGVVEGHTGYLIEPYTDKPSTSGMINWNKTTFDKTIEELDRLGFQVDIHAIGDGAVRMSLDAYEHAANVNEVRDSRHKISHIQLINTTDIPRIATLKIIAALQPNWFYYDENFNNTSLAFLGENRASHMYTLKSIQDSGGMVAFGTDYPVGTDYLTFNPLDGIRTAVTRLPLPPDSIITNPYRPEEQIDLQSAIEDATYMGAYTNFMENESGSLEEGKLADIVILDKDLFRIPPESINTAKVVATYLEGKETFRNQAVLPDEN